MADMVFTTNSVKQSWLVFEARDRVSEDDGTLKINTNHGISNHRKISFNSKSLIVKIIWLEMRFGIERVAG